MSEYKGIVGQKVVSYTTDPDNPVQGQVWYNATANTLKLEGATTSGSWSTAPALNTGRQEMGGNGTTTSALAYGGSTSPGAVVGVTELYNGTSWTEVNDMSTVRSFLGSTGANSTAALAIGGQTPPGGTAIASVEQFNGTNWTEIADLSAAKGNSTAFGTTSAGYSLAGQDSSAINENVEFYNGSTWTEGANVNTGRNNAASAGLGDSGLLICGYAPGSSGRVSNVETWNGSSWTESTNYPVALNQLGGSGNASTSAICFGGTAPAVQTLAALYNGSSWTVTGSLATGNGEMGTSKGIANTAALSFGGNGPPTYRTQTELFTGAGSPLTQTIDTD